MQTLHFTTDGKAHKFGTIKMT